jgi:GH24 family phage-related lysozyme (muramidase)
VRRREASVVSAMNPQTGQTMLSMLYMIGARRARPRRLLAQA